MTWIPPLELQTFFVNVFAGDTLYFGIIALIVIISMAAYFRMTSMAMFLMIGIFIFMLSDFMSMQSFIIFGVLVGGLAIGYWLKRLAL